MGRRSLLEERTAEILDAFERCILRYGLEACTLEQVAEEAAIRRSLVRHYVGNRDDLVEKLVERIAQGYQEEVEKALLEISKEEMPDALLDFLFSVSGEFTSRDKILLNIILNAGERYPFVQKCLAERLERIIDLVAAILQEQYWRATAEACDAVAYTLVNMAMNHDSMMWLGMNPRYAHSIRSSAELLLQSLKEPALYQN